MTPSKRKKSEPVNKKSLGAAREESGVVKKVNVGRGRPRKSSVTISESRTFSRNTESQQNVAGSRDMGSREPLAVSVADRGRGRPRKNPIPSPESTSTSYNRDTQRKTEASKASTSKAGKYTLRAGGGVKKAKVQISRMTAAHAREAKKFHMAKREIVVSPHALNHAYVMLANKIRIRSRL